MDRHQVLDTAGSDRPTPTHDPKTFSTFVPTLPDSHVKDRDKKDDGPRSAKDATTRAHSTVEQKDKNYVPLERPITPSSTVDHLRHHHIPFLPSQSLPRTASPVNRDRSSTCPQSAPTTDPLLVSGSRYRAGTHSAIHSTPPHINLEKDDRVPQHSGLLNRLTPTSSSAPSSTLPSHPPATQPIDIPPRRQSPERPTTPLSGRERPGHGFPPRYTLASSLVNESPSSNRSSTESSVTMSPRSPKHAAYQPSSPLSASSTLPIPIPMSPTGVQQRQRRPGHNLHLAGLPKYHPANFPNSATNAPLSPRTQRGPTSSARGGRGSDAQQHLHQYQRDMMAKTTRQSTLGSTLAPVIPPSYSAGLCARPTSPRLLPVESPGANVTPLALESQSDYLLAGRKVSKSSTKDAGAREWVEKLVQKENERRHHSHTRSASMSPSLSPAVSPAGGA